MHAMRQRTYVWHACHIDDISLDAGTWLVPAMNALAGQPAAVSQM